MIQQQQYTELLKCQLFALYQIMFVLHSNNDFAHFKSDALSYFHSHSSILMHLIFTWTVCRYGTIGDCSLYSMINIFTVLKLSTSPVLN